MSVLLALLAGLGAEATAAQTFTPPKVTCPPSPEEQERLLALPARAFDQDMRGGWRVYGYQECYSDAAKLLDAYARRNPDMPMVASIRWHQVQMLAYAGDTPGTLTALAEVKRLNDLRPTSDAGWTAYVLGTEAFVRGDKAALEKQVTAIHAAADQKGPGEFPARINGNVLKGLLKCFGQPYKVAYTSPCMDMDANRAINAEWQKAAAAAAPPAPAAPAAPATAAK